MPTNPAEDIRHNKKKAANTSEEFEQYFPGFLAFIDSTEQQQIPRPVNRQKRIKAYYSGKKKKRHTIIKNQIIVNNRGFIIHKTNQKRGCRHDYDIYKNNHPVTPKEFVNVFDLDYLGADKDFPEQLSSIPNRKKRNLQLPMTIKNTTKVISKEEQSQNISSVD